MKRSGFTLMELLLVIAILAIVAAIAAPQFFRSSSQALDDARKAQFKANYAAIKAAIKMQLWDEKNTSWGAKPVLTSGLNQGVVGGSANSNLFRLIQNGYLEESAASWETSNGNKRFFNIVDGLAVGGTPTDREPLFMEATTLYEVGVSAAGAAATTFGGYASIEAALRAGQNWDQIWAAVKAALP